LLQQELVFILHFLVKLTPVMARFRCAGSLTNSDDL
jgi:hypothetical protein